MIVFRIFLAVLLLAAPAHVQAQAQAPKVVADIAPVHALVATVMTGLGTPDLIMGANSSPHGVALRPSQARALQAADLVVWVGPGLTPWLGKPLDALAKDAGRLELLAAPETRRLPYRGAIPGAAPDPHAWLDPENGRIWLGLIADRLAQMDPDNAGLYRDNASKGQADLAALSTEIAASLGRMQSQPYVTYHDAYQYFESLFGLSPIGSVTAGDATQPGPAALARLRKDMISAGVTCAFSEADVDPGLIYAAAGRRDLKLIVLDPLGREQDIGPQLYVELLRDMSLAFGRCGDSG